MQSFFTYNVDNGVSKKVNANAIAKQLGVETGNEASYYLQRVFSMIEQCACETQRVSPLSRSSHAWLILENMLQIEAAISQRPVTFS